MLKTSLGPRSKRKQAAFSLVHSLPLTFIDIPLISALPARCELRIGRVSESTVSRRDNGSCAAACPSCNTSITVTLQVRLSVGETRCQVDRNYRDADSPCNNSMEAVVGTEAVLRGS